MEDQYIIITIQIIMLVWYSSTQTIISFSCMYVCMYIFIELENVHIQTVSLSNKTYVAATSSL